MQYWFLSTMYESFSHPWYVLMLFHTTELWRLSSRRELLIKQYYTQRVVLIYFIVGTTAMRSGPKHLFFVSIMMVKHMHGVNRREQIIMVDVYQSESWACLARGVLVLLIWGYGKYWYYVKWCTVNTILWWQLLYWYTVHVWSFHCCHFETTMKLSLRRTVYCLPP